MKHNRLKGYKIIFYIAIIFAVILLGIWRFGIQRMNIMTNPLTKETSGYLLEMLGLTFILFSICMKILIKRDNGLFYIGILAFMMGCWIYLRSGTVHLHHGHLLIIECLKATLLMLAPFSAVLYFNEFQNQRYLKLYQPVMIVSAIDWIASVIALNISMKTKPTVYMAMQMVVILTLAICLYTLSADMIKRQNRYSAFIAGGTGVCVLFTIMEIVYVYEKQRWIDDIYGFGLLAGMILIGLITIYKQIQEQKEYEKMLVEEERNMLMKKLNAEIQKPIQKIIQFSDEMMGSCQDQETYQTAGEIQYESENILKLVENVMSCVQVENGTLAVKKRNIDSCLGMNKIINKCFQQVERKNLEFIVNIAEDFPKTVYGEYDCILKICNILLDNAIRYTENGSITLSIGWLPVEDKEIKVFITVEDTGKGFEEEHLLKIKEVFQQPELTKDRIYLEGVGYGLIAAIGLAREIDGTLRVESERNKGTSMSITFSQSVVDASPIGEFQSWYQMEPKQVKKFPKKDEIRNEIKEEIRKELENEQKEVQMKLEKTVIETAQPSDIQDKKHFQEAVLQLEKESVHIRNAMKYVADDFDQYLCLMKIFVQTAGEKRQALSEMLEHQNYRDYTVKTHALKNNARTLGADDLADMAFAHEKASDKGDISYVKNHIDVLMKEWERVKKVFEEYLNQHDATPKASDNMQNPGECFQQVTDEKVMNELKQIMTYLDTFKKKEALSMISELLKLDLKEETRKGILEVQETVQRYDYAKALTILEKLVG